jgi:hypothetical protein
MMNDKFCNVLIINYLQELFLSIKTQFSSKIKINAVIRKRRVGDYSSTYYLKYETQKALNPSK